MPANAPGPIVEQTQVLCRDGVRLAVYTGGAPDGPLVVAVHGYPDDHSVWDGVVADLSTDHRVVTYDVRGAGASTAPATRAGYRLDQLADDLLAVLDAVAPPRRTPGAADSAAPGVPVHLLGHDWGAVAGWHAVTDARFTGRVASFTSISGPCLDHMARWLRGPDLRAMPAVTRQVLASWYVVAFRLPRLPELAWRSAGFRSRVARGQDIPTPPAGDAVRGLELYRANVDRFADPGDRRTAVPVTVLAPLQDRFVTPALQRCAEPYATDLRVHDIPGGHWVVRHRPGLITGFVRAFVAEVGRGA